MAYRVKPNTMNVESWLFERKIIFECEVTPDYAKQAAPYATRKCRIRKLFLRESAKRFHTI